MVDKRAVVKNVEEVLFVNMEGEKVTVKNAVEVLFAFIMNKEVFVKNAVEVLFVFKTNKNTIVKSVVVSGISRQIFKWIKYNDKRNLILYF